MNEIYWITRCDDISCLLTIVSVVCGILSGIALFIMCIAASEEEDDTTKACIKFTKFTLPAFFIIYVNQCLCTYNKGCYANFWSR